MKTSIPGYTIKAEVIYDSPNTIILHGVRDKDNVDVIIKMFKKEHASPMEIMQFKSEYEITKSFNSSHIVLAYGFEKNQNSFALVLERIHSSSLAKILLTKKKFDLKEFLEMAIKITEAIGEIHQHNIIHNDINPSNVLYDLGKRTVKVIDFGLAASLPKAWTPVVNPNMLQPGFPNTHNEDGGLNPRLA